MKEVTLNDKKYFVKIKNLDDSQQRREKIDAYKEINGQKIKVKNYDTIGELIKKVK